MADDWNSWGTSDNCDSGWNLDVTLTTQSLEQKSDDGKNQNNNSSTKSKYHTKENPMPQNAQSHFNKRNTDYENSPPPFFNQDKRFNNNYGFRGKGPGKSYFHPTGNTRGNQKPMRSQRNYPESDHSNSRDHPTMFVKKNFHEKPENKINYPESDHSNSRDHPTMFVKKNFHEKPENKRNYPESDHSNSRDHPTMFVKKNFHKKPENKRNYPESDHSNSRDHQTMFGKFHKKQEYRSNENIEPVQTMNNFPRPYKRSPVRYRPTNFKPESCMMKNKNKSGRSSFVDSDKELSESSNNDMRDSRDYQQVNKNKINNKNYVKKSDEQIEKSCKGNEENIQSRHETFVEPPPLLLNEGRSPVCNDLENVGAIKLSTTSKRQFIMSSDQHQCETQILTMIHEFKTILHLMEIKPSTHVQTEIKGLQKYIGLILDKWNPKLKGEDTSFVSESSDNSDEAAKKKKRRNKKKKNINKSKNSDDKIDKPDNSSEKNVGNPNQGKNNVAQFQENIAPFLNQLNTKSNLSSGVVSIVNDIHVSDAMTADDEHPIDITDTPKTCESVAESDVTSSGDENPNSDEDEKEEEKARSMIMKWVKLDTGLSVRCVSFLSSSQAIEQQVGHLMEVYTKVSSENKIIETKLLYQMTYLVKMMFPNCSIHKFGSRVSKMALPDSDLDIYIDPTGQGYSQTTSYENQQMFVRKVKKPFYKDNSNFSCILGLTRTKVPIIKVQHKPSSINCDISFKNGMSVENTKLFCYYLSIDPRVKWLVTAIKLWAHYNLIAGSDFFTSHALSWLVLFFLMKVKIVPPVIKLQENVTPRALDDWNISFQKLKDWAPSPEPSSQVAMLKDFFRFTIDEDFTNNMACTYTGKFISKEVFSDLQQLTTHDGGIFVRYVSRMKMELTAKENPSSMPLPDQLYIQDPFELCKNVSSAVKHDKFQHFLSLCCFTFEKLLSH